MPAGACGAISARRSSHGMTASISSRNARLRVLLGESSNPLVARLICFMGVQRPRGSGGGLLQTFPSQFFGLQERRG